MEITTQRLLLKDLKQEDAEQLSRCGNSREIAYFTGEHIKHPFNIQEVRRFITNSKDYDENKRKNYTLGIFLKGSEELMGVIEIYGIKYHNLKANIGYWVGKDYRKKGYVYEASKKMIDFAFSNLELNKLMAKSLPDNKASNSLLEKLGFENKCTLREDWIIFGEKKDSYLWELLKKDWN